MSSQRFSCQITDLKNIRLFLTHVLQERQLPEEQVSLLVLAVDEVCANRMIHSNSCDPAETLEVKVSSDADYLTVEIIDKGEGFNLASYQVPEIQDIISRRKQGGIGLILVSKIMDLIQFEKRENFHVCRLSKSLPT